MSVTNCFFFLSASLTVKKSRVHVIVLTVMGIFMVACCVFGVFLYRQRKLHSESSHCVVNSVDQPFKMFLSLFILDKLHLEKGKKLVNISFISNCLFE